VKKKARGGSSLFTELPRAIISGNWTVVKAEVGPSSIRPLTILNRGRSIVSARSHVFGTTNDSLWFQVRLSGEDIKLDLS